MYEGSFFSEYFLFKGVFKKLDLVSQLNRMGSTFNFRCEKLKNYHPQLIDFSLFVILLSFESLGVPFNLESFNTRDSHFILLFNSMSELGLAT